MHPPQPPPALLHIGPFQRLEAGDDSSLGSYNTTLLADGAFAYVIEVKGIWFLDKLSTSTPDGTNVIQPAVGPGRWVRVGTLPTPP